MVSVVICKHGKRGYTASIRTNDKKQNKEISAYDKRQLYQLVERALSQL